MRIGIIGSGNVGGTLGRRWAENGHEVLFGSRDPSSKKMQSLVEQVSGKAKAGTLSDAAAYGEVLVLATPWPATEQTLRDLGDVAGKIIFDCTNPLKPDLSLDLAGAGSGAEQVASWAEDARIVKVFNTTGYGNMADPGYDGQKATMFFAGDDHVAKSKAARLADGGAVDLSGSRAGHGYRDRFSTAQALGRFRDGLASPGARQSSRFKHGFGGDARQLPALTRLCLPGPGVLRLAGRWRRQKLPACLNGLFANG